MMMSVFEQPAPGPPAQAPSLEVTDGAAHFQTSRRTSMSRILLIARVGFRFFGQTSTQFMIVWQRNRL